MLLNIGNGMPAYAYDDPIVTIEGPDAIMIGQTVTYKYTITYEGEVLDEGEFDFTGSSAGAGQVAGGFSVPVTVTRHPAHGGYYTDDVVVEINKLVDVVEVISVQTEKSIAFIFRPVELTAVVIPENYADQIQWHANENSTVFGWGANAIGFANGLGKASFFGMLTINGSTSCKPLSFMGVDVKQEKYGGVAKAGHVSTFFINPSQKVVIGSGHLKFISSSNIVSSIIADVTCIDKTGYYLHAECIGGLMTVIKYIGLFNFWQASATWNYVSTFSDGIENPDEVEATAGDILFHFSDTEENYNVHVQVGPLSEYEFEPNKNYDATSTSIIRAEIEGPLGTLGNLLRSVAEVKNVGDFIIISYLRDVS